MYHKFIDEDGKESGSFEVFHSDDMWGPNDEGLQGWYWWPCFPGCLPDGEHTGPFASEEEAIKEAQS